MTVKQKIFIASLIMYVLTTILMFLSMFFYFRTFLTSWLILLLSSCVLCGVSAISIIASSKKAAEELKDDPEFQEIERKLRGEIINEDQGATSLEETVNSQEENKDILDPILEVEISEQEETPHTLNLEERVEKDSANLEEYLKSVTAPLTEVTQGKLTESSDAKYTEHPLNSEDLKTKRTFVSYNSLEDLQARAKERRSKEDVVVGWRILNPFGTQKECAKDLNLSMKTIRKWWDYYNH